MSVLTAADLIQKALQKIGVIAEGETPSTSQSSDGLDALNLLLDSWAGRSLLTTAKIRENFPLVAGTASYTIGVGGAFNTSKPFDIDSAFIRDGNNLDYAVDVVTREVYDGYPDKAITTNRSRPTNLFYDPGATQQAIQLGTIYLYPIPDAATTYSLYLESEKQFTQFTTTASLITFPPSYKRALIYHLAIELAPDYGKPITAEIKMIADESMRIVENINSQNKREVVGFSLPGTQKAYDIYSDT